MANVTHTHGWASNTQLICEWVFLRTAKLISIPDVTKNSIHNLTKLCWPFVSFLLDFLPSRKYICER